MRCFYHIASVSRIGNDLVAIGFEPLGFKSPDLVAIGFELLGFKSPVGN